jgi:hypothetical protein
MNPVYRHQCHIYSGAPSHQLPAIADVMVQMMADGHRCLYLNSPTMVTGLRSCLAAKGIDVTRATSERRLVFSSDTVSGNEDFDVDKMLQKLEEALEESLADGYKGLWASGDMTWELGAEKNYDKLLEYEWKLEALFQKRKELHGICQYHCDSLPQSIVRQGLTMHGTLFVNETLSRLNQYYIKDQLPVKSKHPDPVLDLAIEGLCQSAGAPA